MEKAQMELSPASQKLFRKIKRDWAIGDEPGLTILRTAMECLDRITEARAVIKREGITVPDRYGVPKLHPAVSVEKQARAGLLMALKALNLDLETLDDAEKTKSR